MLLPNILKSHAEQHMYAECIGPLTIIWEHLVQSSGFHAFLKKVSKTQVFSK